ncbi:hypothetical protein RchiOBHm_Chr6g0269571 [Rosa chinensis]|uniref:Uncharacterized protein n=1 Tax=Rosa chinensis TaxID=74649 RepID=A0A2P6PQI8_ROSCH|nr:hypothetical protein RchiOBHm_Chr6g0269571 [Rosa chinensis]
MPLPPLSPSRYPMPSEAFSTLTNLSLCAPPPPAPSRSTPSASTPATAPHAFGTCLSLDPP